jgi:pyruvate dehydrogenase E2 component (dihydrolipoamide acetyltransferase)
VRALEYHSESKEVLFAHTPGLKMVIPSTPRNARALLASAMRDPDPVVFFEPKRVYRAFREEVPEEEVVEVDCAEGDAVEEGDTVLAVETDKATTELRAPYSGTVERIHVKPGDQVEVGDLLMTFSGEEEEQGEGAAGETAEAESGTGAQETRDRPERQAQPEGAHKQETPQRGQDAGEQPSAEGARPGPGGPIPAAPSTRRLARELGVALDDVEPTGPGGRVLAEDVRRLAGAEGGPSEAEPTPPGGEAPGAAQAAALPDFTQWDPVERTPYRSVRRATGVEMARSWAEIPHVMHHVLVDITELERFRREQAGRVEARGGKLTLTVLVMKAAVAALRAFPYFTNRLVETLQDPESLLLSV